MFLTAVTVLTVLSGLLMFFSQAVDVHAALTVCLVIFLCTNQSSVILFQGLFQGIYLRVEAGLAPLGIVTQRLLQLLQSNKMIEVEFTDVISEVVRLRTSSMGATIAPKEKINGPWSTKKSRSQSAKTPSKLVLTPQMR